MAPSGMAGVTNTGGGGGSGTGGELEESIDLSNETTIKIEQCKTLVKSGQLRDALVIFYALEKRCRIGNDNASLGRICECAIQCCIDSNDNDTLFTVIQTIISRRSQKTSAIKAVINTTIPLCLIEPYTPKPVTTVEEKLFRNKLTETLRTITDGKLFLERERAQLTRSLASIMEADGDISGAADVLQEVHVETYGSIPKRDKVEFILEQLRLTLEKQDYVRAAIVSGKINRKNLMEESMEHYKITFFTLLLKYHIYERDTFELVKDYYNIYNTPSILNDDSKLIHSFQNTIIYLALSPYSNEQQDFLNRINTDTNLDKVPACKSLVQLLLKKEIINYPLANQSEIESLGPFQIDTSIGNTTELVLFWKELLHRRIIQHNIRIVSIYYERIRGKRLGQLLQLQPEQVENEIATMVSTGAVYAKIDRPKDIIRFLQPKSPELILSDYAYDIDKLLHLVETTTHLIHKENMTS